MSLQMTGSDVPADAPTETAALGFRDGLGVFLERLRDGRNVFHAVTEALARGLGWRFAAVTRFTERPGVVQVLAWWTGERFETPFEYDLAHTPCERVAQHDGFCYFDDLATTFPRDQVAIDLGMVAYGGQVYRDANGRSLGHLLAAHGRNAMSPIEARALFDLLVLVMGLELRHLSPSQRAATADAAARTDPLTGLGNRRAFDAEVARHALDRPLASRIAVIEIDGLAQVNAAFGYARGDALLLAFARALNSWLGPHDRLFRLGGGQFALLALGAARRIEHALELADAEARALLADDPAVRASGRALPPIAAHVGSADPRELGWSVARAFDEAGRALRERRRQSPASSL